MLQRRRLLVAAALCATVWALSAVTPALAAPVLFEAKEEEQEFEVPAGITSIEVVAIGGKGGDAPLLEGAIQGGQAAEVIGILSGLTPGQTLYVEVGGNGGDSDITAEGGFNGGGDGGGGGGGATDIRELPLASGLEPKDTRLIVAAGGGGAGVTGSETGGTGGDAEAPGGDSAGENIGGGAGTQEGPGPGGNGSCDSGDNGQLGLGGAGGSGCAGPPGGGGGGGLYGGGGGGGAEFFGGGGGGGGSSLVPPGGEKFLAGEEDPQVRITVAPAISITAPADGASYVQGQVINSSYSCTQEGTSLKTCAGPVASGTPIDTSTPGSHSFTVNTEGQEGAKVSKTVSYTVAPKALPSPQTKLGSHPKKTIKTKKKKVKVKFTFSSSVPGSTFKCKLDKGQFAACKSPKTYKVKPGKHTFKVVASSGGVKDPTPATFSFKVKKVK